MANRITSCCNSYPAAYMTQNHMPCQEKNTHAEPASPRMCQRKNLAEYARELSKLAPSLDVRAGDSFPKSRTGKTLTIHPGLLNKMQHDPEQEKATKEMIAGAEFLTKWLDGLYKATGRTLVYRHSYIDADGKYRAISYVRNDRSIKMCKKLRTQRQQNTKKLIAKTRSKAKKTAQRTAGAKLDIRC